MKRSPLRARRREPRRAGERLEHGLPMAAARDLVMARSRGRCEVCALEPPTDAHHRLTRRYGPDCPGNLLALCSRCHHERVHGEPTVSRGKGWIVSRHHVGSPCAVPVSLPAGPAFLGCDGTVSPI